MGKVMAVREASLKQIFTRNTIIDRRETLFTRRHQNSREIGKFERGWVEM